MMIGATPENHRRIRFLAQNSLDEKVVYRYEKKFIITDFSSFDVELLVKGHPSFFFTAYPPRYINNIYLDTPGHTHYYDNVNGCTHRKKLRIRWYGDLMGNVEGALLEVKTKQGELGTKSCFPMPFFKMNELFRSRDMVKLLHGSAWPDLSAPRLFDYNPTLINRYYRQYFVSHDKRFRITLDQQLTYYKVGLSDVSVLSPLVDYKTKILELKYGQSEAGCAVNVAQKLPFRVSKNSKYVSGVRRTFFHLAEHEDLGNCL